MVATTIDSKNKETYIIERIGSTELPDYSKSKSFKGYLKGLFVKFGGEGK